jgi:hypothetical protein
LDLDEAKTFILITADAGRITGLNDREWGHIGVKHITSAASWTIEPPQDKL